jgi:hypothetical protein
VDFTIASERAQHLLIFRRLFCSDEKYYDGAFNAAGQRHGGGTLRMADGRVLQGEFKNGELQGHGTCTFQDGRHYKGGFKDGKRCGHGIVKYADGDAFEGDWKDGIQDGHGILKHADGTIRYEGEFKDGKMNGHGIYKLADGSVYEGEFTDGKKHMRSKVLKNSVHTSTSAEASDIINRGISGADFFIALRCLL